MYNSILGRSILIITLILLTSCNVMAGLGLLVLILYMYPDANYMEGMASETGTTAKPIAAEPKPEPEDLAAKASQMMANIMNTTKKPQEPTPVAEPVATPVATPVTVPTPVTTPTKVESFTNNKSNDRISKEERLRPKTSVTSNLYPERGMGVSTSSYNEPSPNSSNGALGFAFLS